jgi:hypothetical protein
MPQRDLEVPGLVPDVGWVELNTKDARRHRSQHGRRQQCREEEVSRKAWSKEDEGRCLDVLAEAMEENRRGLSVVSRGLDLCESTICNDIVSVRTWVVDAMRVQDSMIERMADNLIAAVASILESQRAHRVEEKAAEGVGVGSGGHDVQVMAASAVGGNGTGNALGKPTSSAGALSVQARACDGSCGSAAGAVGRKPDLPRLPVAAHVHIRGGCSAAPMAAAVKKKT